MNASKTNTEPSPAPNKYHKYTNAKDLLKYRQRREGLVGEKRQLEKKRLGRVGLSIGNGASLNLLIHISAPTLPSRSSKAKLRGNKDFGSEAKVKQCLWSSFGG